jgi:hypothetical protein
MYLYGQEVRCHTVFPSTLLFLICSCVQDPSNEFVFVELMANLSTNVLTAKVKSTDDTVGKRFATHFRTIIQQLLN